MSLSESDLAQILTHCRDLLDASTQLNFLAAGRHETAANAGRRWEGELQVTFGLRMQDEADDLSARSRELLGDADDLVRSVEPVAVPTPQSRYAVTGGLESV